MTSEPSTAPEPEPVKVPSVKGKNLAKAKDKLRDAGLLWDVDRRYSWKQPGTILGQDPSSDAFVDEESVVTLVAAQLPPKVPSVTDKRLERAKKLLKRAGFKARAKTQIPSQPVSARTVLSQIPSSGTRLMPGKRVMLTVAVDCQGYWPCLPPGPDVDCRGGTGDGPRYTGPVRVTDWDPYDLDRDNDGYGCEWS